jgi:hypothetical protein
MVHDLLGGRGVVGERFLTRQVLAVFNAGLIPGFVHVRGEDLGNHGFGRKDEERDNGVAADGRYGMGW